MRVCVCVCVCVSALTLWATVQSRHVCEIGFTKVLTEQIPSRKTHDTRLLLHAAGAALIKGNEAPENVTRRCLGSDRSRADQLSVCDGTLLPRRNGGHKSRSSSPPLPFRPAVWCSVKAFHS